MSPGMEAPPLIAEHDTWISLDPLVGCPASCAYCYLNLTNDTGASPTVRTTPEGLIDAVAEFLARRLHGGFAEGSPKTPLCIGNYTDMFMTQTGRNFLRDYVRRHKARLPEYPLCVVTKAELKPEDIADLDELGQKLLVFVSQSFLKDFDLGKLEQGPVCSPAATATNLRILARSRNLIPIHFWRPLTVANVPDLKSACAQLQMVKEAGALASVAIGLKGKPGWPADDVNLGKLMGPNPPRIHGEHMPNVLLDRILTASRQTRHPVYRATSCAVAMALGHAESLGMWRSSFRANYCDPCLCPDAQRHRCELAQAAAKPPDPELLRRISIDLNLDFNKVAWSDSTQMIHVAGTLTQEDHSQLSHITGNQIAADSLTPTRAWLGAITERRNEPCSEDYPMRLFREFDWMPPALQHGINRLKGITGLATTLVSPTDRRPLAFSRYFHVRRIAAATEAILQQLACEQTPDPQRVAWLVWVHDLNRWPFAHNSERGHFRQGDNYAIYLKKRGIDVSDEQLSDLINLEAKTPEALSLEGQIVLLADMLGGFLEDILLCIQGLDLSPEFIPEPVASALKLPLHSTDFRRRLLQANQLLFRNHDVEGFVSTFDRIHAECIKVLLREFTGQSVGEILASPKLREIRRIVRLEFFDHTLFAYNNEKVSRGALLRENLVLPMLAAGVVNLDMTEISETELVSLAVSLEILPADTALRLVPEIDYIMHHEPTRSFRLTEGNYPISPRP